MTHEDGFPKLEAKAFFGLPALPTDQELVEQIQSQEARIEKLERQVEKLELDLARTNSIYCKLIYNEE